MLKLVYAASAVALTAGASMPALAQAQSSPAVASQQPSGPNPNEVVCQKQEIIGSRLATKRICKTRAEWADAQMQDKQELNRVQTQRGNSGKGP
jgi:invasion protein IalB